MANELTPGDREFFQLAHEAAFANPFSPERDSLDAKIGGVSASLPAPELLAAVVVAIKRRLQNLGAFSLADFAPPDRKLLRSAVWFDCFHRFADPFDQLILDQQAAGDRLIPVPFSDEIMGELVSYGIRESEAARVVSIFYQLRRAYFFIGRTLLGHSTSMQLLRRHLWNNIFTLRPDWYEEYLWARMEDFSTLLLGDTGSGKGAVAAAIGRSGFIPFDAKKKTFQESFTHAFVAINLAEYPATLMESELFGHKKGAFTGAVDNHVGVFGRCSTHGAIFIDEIGDVELPTQVKLLRVLQERVFTPVGSHDKQRFSGRVIAATNRDIAAGRENGTFRDDLYYRLCSDLIRIPSLKQRLQECKEELDLLVGHLLERLLGRQADDLAQEIVSIIRDQISATYSWPGNVRELEQCIRRVLITGRYEGDRERGQGSFLDHALNEKLSAAQLMSIYCCQLYEKLGTYEDVAKITNLDRRTVKKYVHPVS